MSDHAPVSAPGVMGGLISIVSGTVAFLAHHLPELQGAAALVCIIAGIASVASVIKHWNK